jgi:hypothetical protein
VGENKMKMKNQGVMLKLNRGVLVGFLGLRSAFFLFSHLSFTVPFLHFNQTDFKFQPKKLPNEPNSREGL